MPVISNKSNIRVPLKTYDQNWKIVYIDDKGIEQSLLTLGNSDSDLLNGSFELKSLDVGTGTFTLSLLNDSGKFNNILKHGTKIKVYADLIDINTTPTNVISSGYIESKKHGLTNDNVFILNVAGRKNPQIEDLHITISFDEASAYNAIKSIIDTYFNGVITYNNMDANMIDTITHIYINQTAASIIRDILKKIGWSGFIDMNNDIRTFIKGGRRNENNRIIYGDNMLPYSDIGTDYIDNKNRIIMYGNKADDMLLVRTKNNTNLQEQTWIKSDIKNNNQIITIDETDTEAEIELSNSQTSPFYGQVTSAHLLPTLNPGELMFISNQYSEMDDYFNVVTIVHNIDSTGGETVVTINKLEVNSFTEIKKNKNSVNDLITDENINDMKDTVIYLLFEDNTGLSSTGDLKTNNGKLVLPTSVSQSTATTITHTLNYIPTYFEIKAKGNTDTSISTLKISFNNGNTFVNNNTEYNLVSNINQVISIPSDDRGKNIIAKITLKSDAIYLLPELEGLSVVVK